MRSKQYTTDERVQQIASAIKNRASIDEFDKIWSSLIAERTEHHTWNSAQMEAYQEMIEAAKTLTLEELE